MGEEPALIEGLGCALLGRGGGESTRAKSPFTANHTCSRMFFLKVYFYFLCAREHATAQAEGYMLGVWCVVLNYIR